MSAWRNYNKETVALPLSCVDVFLKRARRSTPAGWSWQNSHLHRIDLLKEVEIGDGKTSLK